MANNSSARFNLTGRVTALGILDEIVFTQYWADESQGSVGSSRQNRGHSGWGSL